MHYPYITLLSSIHMHNAHSLYGYYVQYIGHHDATSLWHPLHICALPTPISPWSDTRFYLYPAMGVCSPYAIYPIIHSHIYGITSIHTDHAHSSIFYSIKLIYVCISPTKLPLPWSRDSIMDRGDRGMAHILHPCTPSAPHTYAIISWGCRERIWWYIQCQE
jgi:hypothetical protein